MDKPRIMLNAEDIFETTDITLSELRKFAEEFYSNYGEVLSYGGVAKAMDGVESHLYVNMERAYIKIICREE